MAYRGRKNDPLYGIRTILRRGAENSRTGNAPGSRRRTQLTNVTTKVDIAWQWARQLRAAYKASSPVEGRRIAEKLLMSLPTCPIPEIKRLGKTLTHWPRRTWLTSTPAAPTSAAPSNC